MTAVDIFQYLARSEGVGAIVEGTVTVVAAVCPGSLPFFLWDF